jgi:sulfatase modifying factor 1
MGSPPGEPERRPGEDQVQLTLTRGFWTEKYEVTQGDWKRVVGRLPGELTAELPEGDVYSVGNVNFPEAEAFCRKLTELARRSGDLPGNWEFRLPTEAQWEYACRAGTTTATAFGDELSSKQANLKGKPYNGAEPAPSLGKAARVGSYPPNAWGLHDMHGNTLRVVPGLVPRQAARRGRSRPARRALHGAAEPDGRRLAGAPGRGVDRRRLALPGGLRLRFEPDRSYDHIGFRVVAVRR